MSRGTRGSRTGDVPAPRPGCGAGSDATLRSGLQIRRAPQTTLCRAANALAILVGAFAASCGGNQSVVNPAGPQSAHLDRLWWFMCGVCSVVFVLVIGFLLYAVFRRRPGHDSPDAEAKRGMQMTRWVTVAVAATAVILLAVLVVSVVTGRKLWTERVADAMPIRVTGERWWWQIAYPEGQNVITANEIHIPVGRQVILSLTSNDVIHSFWVPNLNGKIDLIPGYTNTTAIQADRPGIYRGQCAEFCGY